MLIRNPLMSTTLAAHAHNYHAFAWPIGHSYDSLNGVVAEVGDGLKLETNAARKVASDGLSSSCQAQNS
jgi:hypothetical protein